MNHLIEMNRCTEILGNLGLGIYEEVSCDMHELDQYAKVLLDGRMVHDNQGCALLGRYSLVGIIQTRQRSNRSRGQARNGSGEYPREPHPDGHIPRECFARSGQPIGADAQMRSKSMTYRTFRRVCVFSRVFVTMELTLRAVCGPMGGDCV